MSSENPPPLRLTPVDLTPEQVEFIKAMFAEKGRPLDQGQMDILDNHYLSDQPRGLEGGNSNQQDSGFQPPVKEVENMLITSGHETSQGHIQGMEQQDERKTSTKTAPRGNTSISSSTSDSGSNDNRASSGSFAARGDSEDGTEISSLSDPDETKNKTRFESAAGKDKSLIKPPSRDSSS